MQVSTVTNVQNSLPPVPPVAKVRRHDGDDSGGRGRSEAHRADGRGDGLHAMLKLKVTQTFANLVATEPVSTAAAAAPVEGDEAAATAGSGLTATLKARLKISFGDDGAQAQIKLRIKAEGNPADLQGLMDRFVGTLQAAIQTLFGTQNPTTAPVPAAPPAVAAPATPALPAPTEGSGPLVDAAAALPTATTAATPTPAAADTTLKLRAAYLSSSADLGFGALVERLAQPDVEAGTPALAPVLEDLSAQFTQIGSLLQPREGVKLSLRSFLSDLAGQGPAPAGGDRSAFSLSIQVRGNLLSATA